MLNTFTVNKTVLSGTCNNTDQCNGCLRTLQSWYAELNILSCASFVLSNVCTMQTWASLEFRYVLDELDGSFLHTSLLQFEIVCIRPCLCMCHAISRQLMGASWCLWFVDCTKQKHEGLQCARQKVCHMLLKKLVWIHQKLFCIAKALL